MTLEEGIKNSGLPFNIPDCPRSNLPIFLAGRGYKVGAEIGVYKGEFTELLCKAGLFVHAVDPWCAYLEETRQARQDFIYSHVQRTLAPYKNVNIVKKMSMDAVVDFEDESLDFVYIDGNHKFRYVAEDLYEWDKKVRKGGVVSGHDYRAGDRHAHKTIYQAGPVIDAYVKAMGIKNFYAFYDKHGRSGDRHASFLWIKE